MSSNFDGMRSGDERRPDGLPKLEFGPGLSVPYTRISGLVEIPERHAGQNRPLSASHCIQVEIHDQRYKWPHSARTASVAVARQIRHSNGL